MENGGEGGIWTHDTLLTYASFQDWCIQPLCHLSENIMVGGGGFEPPKLSRQIYSLIPLAARESPPIRLIFELVIDPTFTVVQNSQPNREEYSV